MKITLIEAAKLYDALGGLADKEMSYRTAHALVLTRSELRPHVEFFAEKEMSIIAKYAEKDEAGRVLDEGGGKFRVPAERLETMQAERAELNAVEVELRQRELTELPDSITPAALEALMIGFRLPEEEE